MGAEEHVATGDAERLLLAIADHLHEHCTCHPGATGDARCGACDLRTQLHQARERVLAWRAEGRRIAAQRDDAIASGATSVARRAEHCEACAALAGIAAALRDDHAAGGRRGNGHSASTSSR